MYFIVFILRAFFYTFQQQTRERNYYKMARARYNGFRIIAIPSNVTHIFALFRVKPRSFLNNGLLFLKVSTSIECLEHLPSSTIGRHSQIDHYANTKADSINGIILCIKFVIIKHTGSNSIMIERHVHVANETIIKAHESRKFPLLLFDPKKQCRI